MTFNPSENSNIVNLMDICNSHSWNQKHQRGYTIQEALQKEVLIKKSQSRWTVILFLFSASSFCEATDTPVLDFWLRLPPHPLLLLHDLSPTCNGFLRLNFGVALANLLMPSIPAEPFLSTYFSKHWWDSNPGSSVQYSVWSNHLAR